MRAPDVAADLEGGRFRQLEIALPLQPVREERPLYLLPEMASGRAAEVQGSQSLPGGSSPAAVVPRSDDEEVEIRRVTLLELPVDLDGTVEVFLVPPAGDVERGDAWPIDLRRHGLALPEGIPVRVCDEVVPRRDLSLEVFRIDVGERAELEVP